MTDRLETNAGTPESSEKKGLIESGLSKLGQKVQIAKYVWEEMGSLYDDFNKMTLEETWDRFKGIFAMGFLGMLMSKEEFEKWKNEERDIDVIEPQCNKNEDTFEMAKEHRNNLKLMKVLPKNKKAVERFKEKYEANKKRYESVGRKTGIPPVLVAAIHYQEGGMNFKTYLHNGDPLGKPTKKHPKNILFKEDQWEEAAIHALGGYKDGRPCKDLNGNEAKPYFRNILNKIGMDEKTEDLGYMLAFAERYNGLGYRRNGKMSSYIYAGTNLAPQGKFTKDGVFDENAKSKGTGLAALILGVKGNIIVENEEEGQKRPMMANSKKLEAQKTIESEKNVNQGMQQFIDEELKSKEGAKVWAKNLEGNGGRSVLTYIPPGVDLKANNLRIIYHFHGTYSEEVIKPHPALDSKKVGWNRLEQTVNAIDQLAQNGENVILVYPLSEGSRKTPGDKKTRAYDRQWMAKNQPSDKGIVNDDFDKLHQDILNEIGIQPNQITSIEAQAHSAGGIALRNMAQSGTKLINSYRFLDASYTGWAEDCYEASRKNGKPDIYLLVADSDVRDFPKNSLKRSDRWSKALTENSHGSYSTGIEGVYYFDTGKKHKEMPGQFTGWRPQDRKIA